MADLTMKQNDTWPPFFATLTDDEGAPVDLTTAETIRILLKGPITIKTGPAAIVGDPKAGNVEYEWQGVEGEDPADLHTAGEYKGEIEVTWEDGSVQTFPSADYFSLLVVEDLG